jgi:crotonobetainyl-CoA:carnitine CoA-transferase CaiB-like acyl-CoA transferase
MDQGSGGPGSGAGDASPEPRAEPSGEPSGRGPLSGVRVLDFTRVLSGPFATMLLADLGAEVIKIERPGEGDDTRSLPPLKGGQSHYFLALNRSKKSVVIDLGDPRGKDLVRRLALQSDVLVENFRPGVAARLGIDYETLAALHPRLVHCSISAFGQDGPYADRPGFDLVVQALSGVMHLTGEPGGAPMRLGLSMGDLVASLLATTGIAAALAERARTGRGRRVEISMLDGMVSLLAYHATRFLLLGEDPEPVGSGHPSAVPYGAFQASDGYVALAPFSAAFWPKVCEALGRPELVADPRYDTSEKRVGRRDEVNALVAGIVAERTVDEWCRRLEDADVPHAPVLTVAQALQHPQVTARGMVAELDHPTLGPLGQVGPGLRMDGSHRSWAELASAPPLLGQHTRQVLVNELGCSEELVDELVAAGVVAEAGEGTA